MWALLQFVLESLIFIFVGLELPVVIRGLGDYPLASVLRDIGLVTLVCIVTRLVWGFPSASITRREERRRYNIWPEVAFVAWAGVRGADSLVIALALPLVIPNRPLIIVITFGVIVATLGLQGLTLGAVVRWLGLGGAGQSRDDSEEARAWIAATEAALNRIDRIAKSTTTRSADATRALELLRETYVRRRTFWTKGGRGSLAGEAVRKEHGIARVVLEDARAALFDQRDRGQIDDAVARNIERYLDLQTMLLDYPDWDIGESPFG